MSLNLRLTLAASVVLAIFVLLSGLTLDRAFYQSAETNLRNTLSTQLNLLLATAEVSNEGELSMPARLLETKFSLPSSGLYAQIVDDRGALVWKSLSTIGVSIPSPRSIEAGQQQFERMGIGEEEFFVLRYGVNWNTAGGRYLLTFNIVSDLAGFNAQIAQYRQTLWGWLIAMALFLLIVQVVILFWGLRPLRRVEAELNAIEFGSQAAIEGAYPREIRRLTDNINGLLHHERAQQQRYRNALADLAHSLKTPLAVLRGAISARGTEKPNPDLVSEQIDRMDHIVAHQLQRAAMAGSSSTRQSLDLRETVRKVTAALDKVYRDKGIKAEIDIDLHQKVRCDEGDLMELAGNLLDNAYKFAARRVVVRAHRHQDRIQISVEDDGPGIAALQIEHILQRGGRLDQSVPGQGIGLSVAQEIIKAYESCLQIDAAPELGGARFRFDLPAGR